MWDEREKRFFSSKVPPPFGFDEIQSSIGRTPKCTASPMCYTKVVGDLRIPAQDAMCASHPFFRPFGVTEVLSQFGRGIEFLKQQKKPNRGAKKPRKGQVLTEDEPSPHQAELRGVC